jgi:hypothetical protein
VGTRAAARLALGTFVLSIVLVGAGVAVLLRGHNPPDKFGLTDALAAVSFTLVGAVVVAQRPSNRVGWLFCAIGPFSGLYCFVDQYARYTLVTRPGVLPGGTWAEWVASWAWIPSAFLILVFLPLLFPDGRAPQGRWQPLGWFAVAAFVVYLGGVMAAAAADGARLPARNPLAGNAMARADPGIAHAFGALFLAAALVGLSRLLARFRGSRGDERQQLKWFLSAATLTALGTFSTVPILAALSVPLLPIAAGVAIVKYRLYDIDRILHRTLVYGLLVAILLLGYAVAVLALGQVLGQRSNLAVAGATLGVAALFQPVRRRVRDTVDRRFNRRRYDAAKTIETFSLRLRDEVDLDTLTAELLTVVNQTMQPTRVSLWLRQSPPGSGADLDAPAGK